MFTVRLARMDDAPVLGQVHCASWRSAYRDILPEEVLRRLDPQERARRMRRLIAETNPWRWLLVAANQDDQAVGFCAAGPEQTGHPIFCGEIYGLYLLPEVQRRGLGRRLVENAHRRLQAAGMQGLVIWVLRDNRSACAFYESLGGSALLCDDLPLAGGKYPCLGYVWDEALAADPNEAPP